MQASTLADTEYTDARNRVFPARKNGGNEKNGGEWREMEGNGGKWGEMEGKWGEMGENGGFMNKSGWKITMKTFEF